VDRTDRPAVFDGPRGLATGVVLQQDGQGLVRRRPDVDDEHADEGKGLAVARNAF
jgi:hypothetical protein